MVPMARCALGEGFGPRREETPMAGDHWNVGRDVFSLPQENLVETLSAPVTRSVAADAAAAVVVGYTYSRNA